MEKVELAVGLEEERMEALTFYLSKKGNTTAQKELEKKMMELYESTVPEEIREYIDHKVKPLHTGMKKTASKAKPKEEKSKDNPAGLQSV